MGSLSVSGEVATFTVEKIGGIDETTVEVPPGVTVLRGRNATNRTSFLQAVMSAHGSEWASIKGDADQGHVELSLGEETYTQTLTRTDNGVTGSGLGLLTDLTVADLFAFLLEDNEARRAVERGEDLREIIMRPVDVASIHRQIRAAEQRKEEIDAELDRIASLKRDLPDLERQQATLRDEITETRDKLQRVEDRIDERDVDFQTTQENRDELETALDELQATRSELKRVRNDIQSEQESIAALRDERGSLAVERSGLPESPDERLEALESDIDRLRERKRELSEYTTRLQNVVGFNEELLSGEHREITDAIDAKPESVGDITDQLYKGSKTTCWTCGSRVKPDRIESTLQSMRDHLQETVTEIDDIDDELDELTDRRDEIAETRTRARELTATIEEVDAEIERRQTTVVDLRERRNNLSARVEELEERVTSLRTEEFDEVLELHTKANELELELDRLESERDEVREEIADIESDIRRNDELAAQREDVVDELIDLRSRIDRLEAEATDQFNEKMDDLLDILGYGNIERIWLERTDTPDDPVHNSDDSVTGSTFTLHVVRSTDGGTVYEDTVGHLSESEREVTGLVFALAGYLVHDVYEDVPFMLLDSLEAIDAERIASLVEYFAEYPTYLVVALLPEDAQALPDSYNRITDI
ncbi:chromosome segregation protein SMC (plasmid) [Haloarcula sp. CBA1115]|uniref:archaea-specific SMC-related protein n=1 Tax=unclassified Haloarcula TaxID=2624677 RepID=UPI00059554FB|nr:MULTISPECIES: archaea-specific SMC-related protein [unclassified Haloarcula]AJF27511.1 chromosome segregation protein SMC [Haloarcula sp. CBA1115]KAA9404218.1 chromosome segregation protein SMC [Haloarcula sp. CBA1131]